MRFCTKFSGLLEMPSGLHTVSKAKQGRTKYNIYIYIYRKIGKIEGFYVAILGKCSNRPPRSDALAY